MTGILGEGARACLTDASHTCHVIHDWAGYLMMPLGLLLLWGELVLLSKLLVAPLAERTAGRRRTGRGAGPADRSGAGGQRTARGRTARG